MNKLTDKQIGYISGIVDGEGSIDIGRRQTNRSKYWQYVCRIRVGNTKLKLLEYLYKITNLGTIYPYTISNIKSKDAWIWDVNNHHEIKELIKIIINDLIIKKEQAELMLEFLDTCKIRYNQYKPMPESTIIDKEIIYDELKILNQRGRIKIS